MAHQPLAPWGHDGRAAIAGLLPQAHRCGCGRSISLSHGVTPGGVQYAGCLEGLVRLAQKLVGVVRCGVWVIVIATCVVVNAIHLSQCHQCGTMLAIVK
jgi:hypothetical protein